jgi:hypothetical protein
MLKPVPSAKFDVFELLLELAEDNHTGSLPWLLGFLHQHLRTKVHKFSGSEILIGIKELTPCFLALPVLVITSNIPGRVACVGILAEIIRRVGDDELSVRDSVTLEVLEVVVE